MPIQFDNSFRRLPPYLYEVVKPTPIKNPKIVHVTALKQELGIDLSDQELMLWLNGEKSLPGEERISSRYAGHQFGVWAGQLGDGRAISLGELITPKGERMEIQTKGSGLTPFSRMGDGKAVIRSSVREYLCSEAMHGLGVPTTRVLALMTGLDEVYRETVERSAVVARVFPSNLRFGHFELCFHMEKEKELEALIEYTRKTFFGDRPMEEMLGQIIASTAKLMAWWQDRGFSHGVMNTDNMSILGLTIDYGPYGFMEDTNLNHVCNHSDHHGRYAYGKQPSVGMWNLERLLVCFMNMVPKEKLQNLLNDYPQIFEREYQKLCRSKLGLLNEVENDFILFVDLLKTLHDLSIDYTFFFRTLSVYQKNKRESLQPFWDYYGKRQEIVDWLTRYDERLGLENASDQDRNERMKQHNPKYILRNYIAQEVIEDVEQGGGQKLSDWLKVFYHPFEEHPEFEEYSLPTPAKHKHYEVSCSS